MNPRRNLVSHDCRSRQKGFALVLTSLMMVFIVSLMGMAVDAGVLFTIRGRLSAAAASAALAAVRGSGLGVDLQAANANATKEALRFLKASLPNNYMGIDPSQTTLVAGYALATEANRPTGLLQITVRAEVAAPVYFMKFWGVPRVPVSADGKATRRNLVVIMVLDKSSSMRSRMTAQGELPGFLPANASPCEGLVYAAAQVPEYFSPYDTVGMVSFDDTANSDFPASTNFKGSGPGTLRDRISRLHCGKGANTTAALETAYREIQRIDQKLALNVVVLFTGGIPSVVNLPPASGIGQRTEMIGQASTHIPDTDWFNNSTRGPKDNWVFQVNRQCAAASIVMNAGNERCNNIGGAWSDFKSASIGRAGQHTDKFRRDHPNTIGVVSMNTAINQAIRMRQDPNYQIRIDSIYLQGNGSDPVDRDFLPMMSNLRVIPPLVYQPAHTPGRDNPLYEPNQPEGRYVQSVSVHELKGIFADVAASLQPLSH